MARKLQNRLALAHFKAKKGWEDLALDIIEPRIDEELRRKRPSSSGDVMSDSSSSTSEFHYSRGGLQSSPLKAAFASQVGSSSSSSGHRKRTYKTSFEYPSSSASACKRFRPSPIAGRSFDSNHTAWKDQHQLAQSSPIRPKKHSHFTTSTGPDVSFYGRAPSKLSEDVGMNYMAPSDEEDDLLPTHSFNVSATPRNPLPRTPPLPRTAATPSRNNQIKQINGTSGQEGVDLLMYLATSPSPAHPRGKSRVHPPSTPPPRSMALPSSMMTTPGGTMSGFGVPNTPSQMFDFSDFVNITPSPAQAAWPKTPGAVKTPMTVSRRRLTYDNFHSGNAHSPSLNSNSRQSGLGMQLGGDLIS
jgi:hypothetical protein